ncbi:hypothetical protein F2Q69_00004819 [Brassica cretica]|uniref:OTU domain-containing protein n=1 Tax=Brassica cretica TaxID=69181 RepID=A0A8S9P2Z4_BRACR|nr:hypothetical protein F2Q69_00004819 [Brassica cretica]
METTNCPCHKLYHMCLQVLYRRFEPNGESRGTVNLLYTAATQHYQSLVRKPGPPENPISVMCGLEEKILNTGASPCYEQVEFKVHDIKGDGSCMYRSLAHQLAEDDDVMRSIYRPKGKGIITKHNQVADRKMQALIRKSIKEAQKVVRANSEKQLFYLFQLKESRARRSGMLRRLKHRRRKERKRSRKGKKRGKKRLKKNARKRRNKEANKNLAGSRFTWCSLIFGIPQLLNARELVWLNLDAQVATPGQSHV